MALARASAPRPVSQIPIAIPIRPATFRAIRVFTAPRAPFPVSCLADLGCPTPQSELLPLIQFFTCRKYPRVRSDQSDPFSQIRQIRQSRQRPLASEFLATRSSTASPSPFTAPTSPARVNSEVSFGHSMSPGCRFRSSRWEMGPIWPCQPTAVKVNPSTNPRPPPPCSPRQKRADDTRRKTDREAGFPSPKTRGMSFFGEQPLKFPAALPSTWRLGAILATVLFLESRNRQIGPGNVPCSAGAHPFRQ